MSDNRHGRRLSPVAALIAAVALLVPAAAQANRFTPPHHRVFHGVSDTGDVLDFKAFRTQVRAHPAVLQDFYHWDTPLGTGALQRWELTRTRGVLSLSTAPGGQPEIVSPGAIANGRHDDYPLLLNRTIAESGQVVYIRLFPEMDGSWNPYSAFNANGSRRGSDHSTKKFRQAWRRFVLIVRGGKRRDINHKLRRLGMPRILRAGSNHARIYRREEVPTRLPHAKVAFIWNPQTSGSPNRRGNAPRDYWPGRRYVDWVGADIYSKYANRKAWRKLTFFYRRWRKWPFVIGEYAPWDADPRGRFTRRLFQWAKEHQRTHMLIYYRSVTGDNIFNVNYYPAARSALRHILNHRRFMQYAPHTR